MAAESVEPPPVEQIVAPAQGQMDQVAAIWLVEGHDNQQELRTPWGSHGRVSITAGAVARPAS
jgi:hypothetical protein